MNTTDERARNGWRPVYIPIQIHFSLSFLSIRLLSCHPHNYNSQLYLRYLAEIFMMTTSIPDCSHPKSTQSRYDSFKVSNQLWNRLTIKKANDQATSLHGWARDNWHVSVSFSSIHSLPSPTQLTITGRWIDLVPTTLAHKTKLFAINYKRKLLRSDILRLVLVLALPEFIKTKIKDQPVPYYPSIKYIIRSPFNRLTSTTSPSFKLFIPRRHETPQNTQSVTPNKWPDSKSVAQLPCATALDMQSLKGGEGHHTNANKPNWILSRNTTTLCLTSITPISTHHPSSYPARHISPITRQYPPQHTQPHIIFTVQNSPGNPQLPLGLCISNHCGGRFYSS